MHEGNTGAKLLNTTNGELIGTIDGGFGGSWTQFNSDWDIADVSWDKVPIMYAELIDNKEFAQDTKVYISHLDEFLNI